MSAPPSSRWVAKLCRRVCGDSEASPARPAAACRTSHAPCLVSRPPRALRKTAAVARRGPGARLTWRRPRPGPGGPDEIGLQRLARVAADRDDALLAALAGQPDNLLAGQVELVDVEADGLRDPRTRPVQELEQGPVPELDRRGRVAGPGRGQQPLHLVHGDRLGQPPRRRRRPHLPGRVGSGQPLRGGEGVQPAHRDHGPPGGAGGQRSVLLVPLPQPGQEGRDVRAGELAYRHLSPAGQRVAVAQQIPAVGLERAGGEPALDRQVIEVPADRLRDRDQFSTSHRARPRAGRATRRPAGR